MLPDRVSNQRPLALESDALQTELRGPARWKATTGDGKQGSKLTAASSKICHLKMQFAICEKCW